MKNYSELVKIKEFEDRLNYLKLSSKVGDITFGGNRYLNQMLYRDPKWKSIRREVILRDSDGDYPLDLAHEDYPILDRVYIHHINPITVDDILKNRFCVFDLENLITTSNYTHNYIHYGSSEVHSINYSLVVTERKPHDTSPWRY